MKWAHPLGKQTIKERLAEVLTEKLGYAVFPDQLWLQPPGVLKAHVGIARWGWMDDLGSSRLTVPVSSWDTMKDCLKYGFTLDDEKGYLCACANEIK